MQTIGRILPGGAIEKEFYNQGFIYKNFDAFNNKSNDICYAGENDDEGETYQDFIDAANYFINNNDDVKKYCEKENITAEDIALSLFMDVDWQHSTTLLLDWEIAGAYTE